MALLKDKSFVVNFVFILCFGLSGVIFAQDTETMLKQVSNELRQAEQDMFGGKTDKAIAALENINKLLGDIKANDPNNTKLKTAENKYRKLVKDLERRSGKNLGGGTLTTVKKSTETELPTSPQVQVASVSTVQKSEPASASESIPYAARKPLSNADRLLASLDGNLNNLQSPDYGGNKDQLVSNMEKKLAEIAKNLDEAKKLAAQKGVTTHPEFLEIDSRLEEAESIVAEAKGGHEENKVLAAAKSGEITAAVTDLKKDYDQVRPIFDRAIGTVFHYNDLKTVEEVIVAIENFEQNEQPKIQSKMQAFANKYGSTRDEIEKNAQSMGYSGQYKASFPYTEISTGIENIKKTRTVMAEDLVRRINAQLESNEKGHDFSKVDRFADVKEWLKMANRYQADNPKVKEINDSLDEHIAKGMKDFYAEIDKRNWDKQAANAPANANQLAKAALDWFKNSPDWGQRSKEVRKPLEVTVTGPWSVQKKNLLGEPIMYGLPIKLAVQVDSEKELNLARVYILTMRTMEKRGVKMEPPFDHITVGDSYYIRPSAIN